MSLAALTLRSRGIDLMLRFRGGATRRVRGVLTRSPSTEEFGGRERVTNDRVLSLARDDADGIKPGDQVEANDATYKVNAVLDNETTVEVELAAA